MLRTLIDPIDIKYTCLHALRPEASGGETRPTSKRTNNLSIHHCIDGIKGRSIIRKKVDLREAAVGTLMKWTGLGSIMNVTFTTTPVEEIRCPEDFGEPMKVLGDILHLFLLEHG